MKPLFRRNPVCARPDERIGPMIGGDTVRRWSPGRDVAWALALKVALLLALYLASFGPSHRVLVTPARVAAAFALTAPSQ